MAMMPLDAWASLAQVGTFIVIAVTAIAALVQLRHLRAANQVTNHQTFFQMYEGVELRDAFHFVRRELNDRLKDPAFRSQLRTGELDRALHPEITICNFFDQWGGYYRMGVIDRHAFMRQNAGLIGSFWEQLSPVVALVAVESNGVNTSFEQFEYLASQAQEWMRRLPQGDFPKDARRMPLVDPWRDIDASPPS